MPDTCGVAIDVPLIVFVASSAVHQEDKTSTPGANRSTQLPQFENQARLSEASVAPTVIALGARAGLKSQASASELPAATTTVTPAADAASTAASSGAKAPPPR